MVKHLFNNRFIKLHIQDKKNEDDSTTLQILNYKVFGFHKAGENDSTLFFSWGGIIAIYFLLRMNRIFGTAVCFGILYLSATNTRHT